MSANVNDLEQYGRHECHEIRDIPFREDEQLNDVVCSIGCIINVNIKPEDISIDHRLKMQSLSRDSTPAIIVKFVSRTIRDRLCYARKYLKDKSTSDIDYGRISDNKIFYRRKPDKKE